MATASQWISAARPRTLPAAIAPVLAGFGAAAVLIETITLGSIGRAALALVVSLALQIGVNYANDYSDGIRGTDGETRVGPFRLVGSGSANPRAVKIAAFACFAVAGAAGLVLAIVTVWWLLLVGAAAIAAAWFYTGGPKPYGYAGYGELFVFIFFGLVAVLGTTFVVAETVSTTAILLAIAIGSLACAILVANNLRDRETDIHTGKRTLAVVLGDGPTRWVYVVLMLAPFLLVAIVGITYPWALIALAIAPAAARPVLSVIGGARGPKLIEVLAATGMTEFAYSGLVLIGLLLER